MVQHAILRHCQCQSFIIVIACGNFDGCDTEVFFLRAALIPHESVYKIHGRCIEVDVGEHGGCMIGMYLFSCRV